MADSHQINFVTTPITNSHFRERVFKLVSDHLELLRQNGEAGSSIVTASRAEPILPPLTPDDTSLFPPASVSTYTTCVSPWIDLCSTDPFIASISRQVLNLELNYANFCGARTVVITGPSRDASRDGGNQGLAQYSRAVLEALKIGSCMLTIVIHMPMYREPLGNQDTRTLASLCPQGSPQASAKEVDLFGAWESWHHVRSVCDYNLRLFVGMCAHSPSPTSGG